MNSNYLIDEAIRFATLAHEGACRKGGETPYIFHCLETMLIVSQMTEDREIIAAAVLHDVVEDTSYTVEDIKERFGERVANFVAEESEDKRDHLPKESTWKVRKQEQIEHIAVASHGAKLIMLGDKLANMRSTLRDFKTNPETMWDKFNMKDSKEQEWYFRSVAKALVELENQPAYQEFCIILDIVFKR